MFWNGLYVALVVVDEDEVVERVSVPVFTSEREYPTGHRDDPCAQIDEGLVPLRF